MTDEVISSVLAKPEIIRQREEGNILITPYDERQVNNASYDVRLGNSFWREKDQSGVTFLDPYNQDSSDDRWELVKPVTPGESFPLPMRENEQIVVLQPGEFMLAHTHEFIGSVDTVLTHMVKGRSTSQRLAVSVCNDAGWGDIGYATRYTLELKNLSRQHSIILRPGQRVAQLVFMPTSGISPDDMYEGKYMSDDAKAQLSKSFEDLVAEWEPERMLPRAYRDWDLDAVRNGEFCGE